MDLFVHIFLLTEVRRSWLASIPSSYISFAISSTYEDGGPGVGVTVGVEVGTSFFSISWVGVTTGVEVGVGTGVIVG